MIKKIMFVSLLLAGGSSWAVAQPSSQQAQQGGNVQTMTLTALYKLAEFVKQDI